MHGSSAAQVEGIISLILWSLIVLVSVKYVGIILRADNHGEGGILALLTLAFPEKGAAAATHRTAVLMTGLGIFGAALLYGDGMITPAISVLSAVEGLTLLSPAFGHWTVPLTVGILVGLFAIQKKGSGDGGPHLRAGDAALVCLPCGHRDRAVARASANPRRAQSAGGLALPHRPPRDGDLRARQCLPRRDGRRSALCGPRPLRARADPEGLEPDRAAGARVELPRPGRARAHATRRGAESLLPPRAQLGARADGGALDRRDDHRLAGAHLRRFLAHDAGDADGLPAADAGAAHQ